MISYAVRQRWRWVLAGCCLAWVTSARGASADPARPNVLFIVLDDQNDWVGCLDGHPLARTPHLDRLADRGTLFTNAHCQAPICNPSRASVLVGLRTTTMGIYGLSPWFRQVEGLADRVTLPQYFAQHGYRTFSTGKVFHQVPVEDKATEFDVWGPGGGVGARPDHKLIGKTPMGDNPAMDWGVFPHRDEDKQDYRVASWAIEQLAAPQEHPFFLAVGFSLPHVPCYITQPWMDLYPDDDTVLPAIDEHDRDDTPRFSWYLHWSLPEPRLRWLREHDQWRNLVRSYLASSSFVDAQVGRVLEALESQGLADNTIVVLWSDHGWHLGEKSITGKNSLWERSTRVPLVFAGPGVSKEARCSRPVELLDIFPTLVELCGLPPHDDLEGHSLVPLLKDATTEREWPAITSHNQGNHSVRSERWRYIHYADGSEELYDMEHDPHEWKNLAGDAAYADVLVEHRHWLPKIDKPPVPGSKSRILTYDPATGAVTWEDKPVLPSDPIPE